MSRGVLSTRRRAWGYGGAVAAPLVAAAVLKPLQPTLNLASDVSVYLVVVVAAALVGGLGPALVSAGVGALALNYWFTPPYGTLSIRNPNDVIALVAFVTVAALVSWVVDLAARRSEAAAAAAEVEAADRLRTALLAAVGHDLRTPLAAAKAAVSGLRSHDIHLDEQDRQDLLATADASVDRLTGLVENLLDMSRLQAGAMPVHLRSVPVEDVVIRALDDLGVQPRGVVLDIEEGLPPVLVDPGLLERVVVNLVANAQRYSPAGEPPVVSAAYVHDAVVLQVVDRGPGIPAADHERVFQPFQRLGDTDPSTGTGLGLALARGLVEAMAGTVTPQETRGGGLTMTVTLRTGDVP